MERQNMNDFHKKSSEASQKEVEQMRKHPLSREEMLEQITRGKELAAKMYAEDAPRLLRH
jgi:U3 small nucleolar RNA-associated protein 14